MATEYHTAWGAPDWTDKYRAEVTAFLRGASAGNAAVLLVGLPAVRSAEENADLLEKSAMYAAAVTAFGNHRHRLYRALEAQSHGQD